MPSLTFKCCRLALAGGLGMWGLVFQGLALAQPVGEVEFARGAGFAQSSNQSPRILGRGVALNEGDRLTTAEGASAILKLNDGTRMTVRPNSEIVIEQFKFRENASDNSFVMQLLRGGLRAITGLIAKTSPDAARLRTSTATIGIRGTDFDARLCASDCAAESTRVVETPRPNAVQASAKLVGVQGEIMAVESSGARRRLVNGASVYPGEVVETGTAARGVLAFRDESRLTLGGASRFRIDSFVFDEKNPSEGRFLMSLLRGSLRALTGLIGKSNNRNVAFTTPTATIGIRGTGLDLDCTAEADCRVYTWQGIVEVTPNGQAPLPLLQAGQGVVVGAGGVRPLATPPLESLPRPDGVQVDTRQLFETASVADNEPGLFVFVREGHIEITSARETLHLGKGETGFAGTNGSISRPILTPLFIEFDQTPMPSSVNPLRLSVLSDVGSRTSNQCR